MNRFIDLKPQTAEGVKLLQAMERNNICGDEMLKLVYEKTLDRDGYSFKCEFNEEIDYGENCVIVPVTSTFYGTVDWRAGMEFANVLGSSGDKGRYGGKQKGWQDIYNALALPWQKYEQPYFFDCFNRNPLTDDKFTCNLQIIGGHVITGRTPSGLNRGDSFYIVPICQHHNTLNKSHTTPRSTPGNGNGFFMKLNDNRTVVKMTGFLYNNAIE